MEFPCFYPSSIVQNNLQQYERRANFMQNKMEEDEEDSIGFQPFESQYLSLNNQHIIEGFDESSTQSQSSTKKESYFDQDNEDDYDQDDDNKNKKVVLAKKEIGFTTFKLNKAIKCREFYHLCFDFFFLADLFGQSEDEDFLFYDYMNKLQLIRPTNTFIKYKNFTAYLLEITETGQYDHTVAINRLVDAQHINAYNIANRLQELQQIFQGMYDFSKKLKSIYNWDKVVDDINLNYQKSFEMAIDRIKKMPNVENRYLNFIIRRVCPQTLTEKYSVNIVTDALINLISNNQLQDANQFFMRKYFPNILDLRSLQEILYKFSLDDISLQSIICCLDNEQIPCKLNLSRQNLSGYEICPGVVLYDTMIIFEYEFNPNLIKALAEKRSKSTTQIDFFDFRYAAVAEIFKDKFYKQ